MVTRAAAGLLGFVLGLGAAAAVAQTVPELILSVAPSPLRPGSTGTLQVQIASPETLTNAVLTASAPSGLTVSPARMAVGRVRPPGGPRPPTTPIFNERPPPALGVVPVRNLRVTAGAAGEYDVTVTLSFEGGSVSRSLTISAR